MYVLIPWTHLVELFHNYSDDIVFNLTCWLCLHFLHKIQVYCYYSFGPPVAFLFLILLLHFTDFTYHLLGFDFWCSFNAWIAFKTCNTLAKNEAFLPKNPLSKLLLHFTQYQISFVRKPLWMPCRCVIKSQRCNILPRSHG